MNYTEEYIIQNADTISLPMWKGISRHTDFSSFSENFFYRFHKNLEMAYASKTINLNYLSDKFFDTFEHKLLWRYILSENRHMTNAFAKKSKKQLRIKKANFVDRKLHSDKGPAVITTTGTVVSLNKTTNFMITEPSKIWVQNGVIHREGGPAILSKKRKDWFTHGKNVTSEIKL